MLLIGTPSSNGTVSFNHLTSLLALQEVLQPAGITVRFEHVAGESLISRARNFIANTFLWQTTCSHLLFIDSDIGFPAEAALRYLQADLDIICGIYPLKRLDIGRLRNMPTALDARSAFSASLAYAVKLQQDPVISKSGLFPVEYGPAGFMMIKRQVFTRMAEAYPELRYRHAYIKGVEAGQDHWAFFDPVIDAANRDYLPEDYAFCKRWRDLGGTIYADVHSQFTHSGWCDYPGDFKTYLRNASVS